MAQSGKKQHQAGQQSSGRTITDDELIAKIRSSRQRGVFDRLYCGDAGEDQSAADLKLCGILAVWAGRSVERLDRIFRGSGLMREKWDITHSSGGLTDGELTIAKAIEGCAAVYGDRMDTQFDPIDDPDLDGPDPRQPRHSRQSSDSAEPIPLRAELSAAKTHPVKALGHFLQLPVGMTTHPKDMAENNCSELCLRTEGG